MSDFSSRLPARPSLEQLQKQAKELLKRYLAGESAALDRFRAVSPRFSEPNRTPPSLADAQFVLAREYGFQDWARLKEQVGIMRASGPLFISSKSPFYTVDWVENLISVQGPQTERDWDAVFGVMKEHKLSKLTAGGISDAALERLPNLDQVTCLHIGGSRDVTDHGIRNLARMPQLQDLVLGGRSSSITDGGLDVLRHLAELRRFQACWTPGLSDIGLAGLSRCDHLEDVNLLGTQSGDGAIQAFIGKRQLRRFQSGQRITDSGLALLHKFPIFSTWQGGDTK